MSPLTVDGSHMTDTWGTVTAVDDEGATIRVDDSGCGRCREPGGCGGNNLAQLLCRTPRTFRVPNPDRCTVGERVRVGVAEGSVASSAPVSYTHLPLCRDACLLIVWLLDKRAVRCKASCRSPR